jgi:hypothetical protein
VWRDLDILAAQGLQQPTSVNHNFPKKGSSYVRKVLSVLPSAGDEPFTIAREGASMANEWYVQVMGEDLGPL